MRAPKDRGPREFVHHVKTERGTSHYQIRRGMGDAAEVVASVAVFAEEGATDRRTPLRAYCTECRRGTCQHAVRVLERANSGR